MEIKRAREENLTSINELILASRSVWNYPTAYFEGSRHLVQVNLAYLTESLCFEVHVEGRLAGFFALKEMDNERYLDHLWIDPRCLRQGLGRFACEFVERLARRKGWVELLVYPDPAAEGFYLRQGFRDTGIRVPSRHADGPRFGLFKMTFDHALNGKVSGLSHVTLTVCDLETSTEFYHNTLGFELLAIRQGKSAYLRAGPLWLALVLDPEKTVLPNDYGHLAFFATGTNFNQLAEKVRIAKCETWQENRSPGRSLYIKDPSGNRLEIHEETWRERIGYLHQNSDPSVTLFK